MLSEELARLSEASVNIGNLEIKGVTENSKEVKKGFVFAALSGAKTNGEAYIQEALANGAVAILLPKNRKNILQNICCFYAENPRRTFALMVYAFHNRQPENIVAVTGTNGKTSTSVFTRQIWKELGFNSASMGTIGIVSNVLNTEGNLTSPPPTILYDNVSELTKKGISNLALEASSHGIDQCRLDALKIKAAGFTNLTRDHLDYHKTMENYLMAKMRLFSDLVVDGGAGVINADVPEGAIISSACKARKLAVISYGFTGKDIKILNHRLDAKGQNLLLSVLGKKYNVRLPLAGDFQAMNALCALGLVLATGADRDKAVEALENLKGSTGRLENVVTLSNGATVYVDYAHTPDALENVLSVLRPNTVGKLSVLFGCGGDRDKGKRPQMGEIATRLADKVIVTDDNPRTENATIIRSEIMVACPNAIEIAGRKEAIFTAIKELEPNDVLLIAGKGHETGQKIGDKIYPFNDKEEALKGAFKIDSKAQEGQGRNPFILWNTQELARLLGARTELGKDVYGLTANLKDIKPGDIYLTLYENKAKEAMEAGAVAVITQDAKNSDADMKDLLVVGSLSNALDDIAQEARDKASARVISIFSSNSKDGEELAIPLSQTLAKIGKSAFIKNKYFNSDNIKIGFANITSDTKFVIITHFGKEFSDVGEAIKTSRPDVIVIPKKLSLAKIEQAFIGANVGASLVIDSLNKDKKEIILEAKANGINHIFEYDGKDMDGDNLKIAGIIANAIAPDAF